MEKIIKKLKEMSGEFNQLKAVNHRVGKEKYYDLSHMLDRIIDRIYPEKDANRLKSSSIISCYIVHEQSEAEEQEEYIEKITLKIRTIDTIIGEFELFGFDNFKPVKEKVEVGGGINTGFLSLGAKKTMEK